MVIRLLIVFLFSLLLSCKKKTGNNNPDPNSNGKYLRKVLIIGIDGCRPDALAAANTPNLDALMANGTFSLDARNDGITMSGPGWTSMLSGVWADKHGVVNNTYAGSDFSNYPHLFKRVKDQIPGSRTVSIVEWKPINDYHAKFAADVVVNASSDGEVKNAAANELLKNNPTVLFLQFSNVDYAGHASGFSPANPNYINAIETVDQEIGGVLDALKTRKTYSNEDWVIIISTDHGGIGTSHGGDSNEERNIFLIVSGKPVQHKEISKTSEEVNIPPVNNCLGSSHELMFGANAVMQVSNKAAYNFGSNQDFSIECRMRGKIPADVAILAKKNWNSGLQPGFVFSFNTSSKNFKVNVGDGTHRVDIDAGVIITDNEWHTLSTTFDRDGLLKLYIDGQLRNSTSMVSIGNIDNSLPFTVGADGNSNWPFNGYIGEVRIFNTVLDASDVDGWKCKQINNGHAKYSNLVGYWKMNEGTGAIINDASFHHNNGAISGAIWKDATQSTIETVYHYENTPRTVDVVRTALNHLCIPIQTGWNIEGKSLINSVCN